MYKIDTKVTKLYGLCRNFLCTARMGVAGREEKGRWRGVGMWWEGEEGECDLIVFLSSWALSDHDGQGVL